MNADDFKRLARLTYAFGMLEHAVERAIARIGDAGGPSAMDHINYLRDALARAKQAATTPAPWEKGEHE